jgi:hypothetical protein
MDEYKPTRRQLHKMIRNQGTWLVILTVAVIALITALARKGVLSWDDLANLEAPADG